MQIQNLLISNSEVPKRQQTEKKNRENVAVKRKPNETSQANCSNQTKMQIQNLKIIPSQIEDAEMSVFNVIRKKIRL